jgi:hypothetical protein
VRRGSDRLSVRKNDIVACDLCMDIRYRYMCVKGYRSQSIDSSIYSLFCL